MFDDYRVPDAAAQLRILADLCDAADPFLSPAERTTATDRAMGTDPMFAVTAAASLMHSMMTNYRQQFGDAATRDVLARLRVVCARIDTLTEEDPE